MRGYCTASLLFIAFFIVGCSARHGILLNNISKSIRDSDEIFESMDNRYDSIPPLEVFARKVDSQVPAKLKVEVRLKSKTTVNVDEIILHLLAYDAAELKSHVSKNLSELLNAKTLLPDGESKVVLSLYAPDADNFRVACEWGQRSIENLGSRFYLVVKKIETNNLNCPESECDVYFSVLVDLINATVNKVTDVVIALGIYWKPDDRNISLPDPYQPIQANERMFSIPGLILEPGKSKAIKIHFDQSVPQMRVGKFVPHVRLLSSSNIK